MRGNSEGFIALFTSWPPEVFEVFKGVIMSRAAEFRSQMKAKGSSKFLKEFYKIFDDAVAQDQTVVSCSKGCNFCCKINVEASPQEVLVITEYCRANNITISRAYLEEQLKHTWKELSRSSVASCVFLKDGLCSIYPVRPIACRNYFVKSKPELCDVITFDPDKGSRVLVAIKRMPMALAIACMGVLSEVSSEKRLPELLLPYSK